MQHALELQARRHSDQMRELASRIASPEAFAVLQVAEKVDRLATSPSTAEWKLIAAEFSLSPSIKGVKGVEEVLFKLTGHRPVKAKAARSRSAPEVDQGKIGPCVERLPMMPERAKAEAHLSETEVAGISEELDTLKKAELAATAKQAGIDRPASSKKAILEQIQSRRAAGKRVLEQTAQ